MAFSFNILSFTFSFVCGWYNMAHKTPSFFNSVYAFLIKSISYTRRVNILFSMLKGGFKKQYSNLSLVCKFKKLFSLYKTSSISIPTDLI